MIKEIPEFEACEFEAAIWSCIERGVSKVSSFLSETSIKRLTKRVNYGGDEVLVADSVMNGIPELFKIRELFFTDDNIARGIQLLLSGYQFDPTESSMAISAHIDSHPSSVGLSVLMPVAGNLAIFAASKTKFDLSIDTFYDEMVSSYPDYAGEYGVGDAMLIRQKIAAINDQMFDLPAVFHCGAADTERSIAALDIVTSNFTLIMPKTLVSQ